MHLAKKSHISRKLCFFGFTVLGLRNNKHYRNSMISNSTHFTSSTPSAKSAHCFLCERCHMGSISLCRFWRTTWEISGFGKWQGSVFGKLGWVCVGVHLDTPLPCLAAKLQLATYPFSGRMLRAQVLRLQNCCKIYGNVMKQAHKQGYKFIVVARLSSTLSQPCNRHQPRFCLRLLVLLASLYYLWPFGNTKKPHQCQLRRWRLMGLSLSGSTPKRLWSAAV